MTSASKELSIDLHLSCIRGSVLHEMRHGPQLDSCTVSAVRLQQPLHPQLCSQETYVTVWWGLQKQNVGAASCGYLASRVWAKTQRQRETWDASFPAKKKKKQDQLHIVNCTAHTEMHNNHIAEKQGFNQVAPKWSYEQARTIEGRGGGRRGKLLENMACILVVLTKKWNPVSYESCELAKETEFEEKEQVKWWEEWQEEIGR